MKRKLLALTLALVLCLGLCMSVSATPRGKVLSSPVAVISPDSDLVMGAFIVSITDSRTYILADSMVVLDEDGEVGTPRVFLDQLWVRENGSLELNEDGTVPATPEWTDENGNMVLLSIRTNSDVTKYHEAAPLGRLSKVSDGDTLYRLWIYDDEDGSNVYGELTSEHCVSGSGRADLDGYPDGQFELSTGPKTDNDNWLCMGGPVATEDGVAVGISAYVKVRGELVNDRCLALDELIDYLDDEDIPYSTTSGMTAVREPGFRLLRVIAAVAIVVGVIGLAGLIVVLVIFSSRKKKATPQYPQNPYPQNPYQPSQQPGYQGYTPPDQQPQQPGYQGYTPPDQQPQQPGYQGYTPPDQQQPQQPAYQGYTPYQQPQQPQQPAYQNDMPDQQAAQPGGAASRLTLVGTGGVMNNQVIPLEQNAFLRFGTDANRCRIVYPAGSPGISSLHCQLANQNGMWVLMDLGSASGTFLRGQRLLANRGYAVQPGDVIWLGSPDNSFTIREVL